MLTAIVSGAGGQDGQELSLLLISEGYKVVGINRRSSQPRNYLSHLKELGVEYVEGDISDYSSMAKIISQYKPDYFYHLAAQSNVGSSFQQPLYTFDMTGRATLNILEVIKDISPKTRFYNAASSEMFGSNYSITAKEYIWEVGDVDIVDHYNISQRYIKDQMRDAEQEPERYSFPYQDEDTPMRPMSVYGIAKLASFHATRLYRESYDLWAVSGILFNHEGIYRSLDFVTRKITNYVSRLKIAKDKGKTIEKLKLGNMDSYRDWSDSSDMVVGMKLILENDIPKDFVLGSGETHTVREFAEKAFAYIDENFIDHIEIDPALIRPAEVDYLRANPTKAKTELGWTPKISFDGLIERMIVNDLKRSEIKYLTYGDI